MDSIIVFSQIVLINLLLSGDNAIIIAMVSNQLPADQRNKAIWLGTLAAVVLRCLLVLLALPLLSIPLLQAAGGIVLLFISIKLLIDLQKKEDNQQLTKQLTMAGAIWTIFAADFVMSLDNVLAIAAVAKGDLVLIMLGIAISIPMIIWGSKLLDTMLKKFAFLGYIGAGCLAYAAGEMIIKDDGLNTLILHKLNNHLTIIPLLCIPIVIIAALMSQKRNIE